MDYVKANELIPLSVELNKWVQRTMYQLQTAEFDESILLSGQYYILGYKLRKFVEQVKAVKKVLDNLELDLAAGTLLEVGDSDEAVVGKAILRLVKSIYGDDFEFQTLMITQDEDCIVTAFEREVDEDGRQTD